MQTQVLSAAIRYYMGRDPKKAKKILLNNRGVIAHFDNAAVDVLEDIFNRKTYVLDKEIELDTLLRQIFEEVGDKKYFLKFLARDLKNMTSKEARLVFDVLPELVEMDKYIVFDFLAFSDFEYKVEVIEKHKLESDILDHFNSLWRTQGLSNDKLIDHIYDFDDLVPDYVFDPELIRIYLLDALIYFANEIFDMSRIMARLDALTEEEKNSLYAETFKKLLEQKEFVEAAEFAKRWNLREMEIFAATLAYKRYFNCNEYELAAELTLNHRIPDVFGAAQKELDRMSRIIQSLSNDKGDMVHWAMRYGLKLRRDQVRNPSRYMPEDLLQVGCKDLAKIAARRLLREHELLRPKYLSPQSGYFSKDEIVREVGEFIADNIQPILAQQEFKVVKETYSFLEKIFPNIVYRTFVEWLKAGKYPKSLIEAEFAKMEPMLSDLSLEQALQCAIDETSFASNWEILKQIYKEWKPEELELLLEIENTNEPR